MREVKEEREAYSVIKNGCGKGTTCGNWEDIEGIYNKIYKRSEGGEREQTASVQCVNTL